MEGSEKWLSPSKPASSPKSPKIGVNDENDSSQANVFPNFHNEKKTAFKHFMSTTVSAASKAATPRRKILSERDKHSIDSGFQTCKTSYANKRQSTINTSPDFMDHSSLKAYDPLKNLLSPRPKFLRFNPNRRREIVGRLEKEVLSDSSDSQEVDDNKVVENSSFSPQGECLMKPDSEDDDYEEEEENEEDDSSDSSGSQEVDDNREVEDSSFPPPRESFLKSESDNDDDEEDEENEEDEERGWCFRGLIVKFAMILIACAVSTSYICTMNSGSSAPAQQGIWGVKDGFLTTKRQTFEMIGVEMWGPAEAGDNCGEFEEGEFLEANVDWEDQRSLGLEIIEDDVQNFGVTEVEENENGKFEEKTEEGMEIENGRSGGKSEVKNENLEKSVSAEIGESVNESDTCSSEVVDSSCLALNDDNMEKIKAPAYEVEQSTGELADKSENAEKNDLEMEMKAPPDHMHELKISEKTEASENKIEQLTGRRTGEKENADKNDLEKEMKAPDQTHELKISEKTEAVENKIEQPTGETTDESENADKNILEKETTEALDQMQELELADKSVLMDNSINSFGILVQDEESGRKMLSFFRFSVVPIILASLAIAIYHSKRKPRNGSSEKYKPVLDKPSNSGGVEEKRKVEFIARPSIFHRPMEEEEASRKFYHSQIYAPTVELIGEIVVGQPSSRRIRKNEAKSPEKGNVPPNLPEHETLSQAAVSEYSNISATSYGSFTTQMKVLKKEGGGKSGECKLEVTPVRRSSRIQSRAAIITSP